MPRALARLAALALSLALPGLAATPDCANPANLPETASDVPELRPVIESLIGWIALHTDYDVSEIYRAPPEVTFCDVGDVIDYNKSPLEVLPELDAAYDHGAGRVFLVNPFDPSDPRDRSVLLHELVHQVQLENRDWPCANATEFEAYFLQSLYLDAFDIESGFDWRAILLLSMCPAAP